MKMIITAVILLTLFCGCARSYTENEALAMGMFALSGIAAFKTTETIVDAGGAEITDMEIVGLQLSEMGILWLLGEIWPDKREALWYSGTIGNMSVSISNYFLYQSIKTIHNIEPTSQSVVDSSWLNDPQNFQRFKKEKQQ